MLALTACAPNSEDKSAKFSSMPEGLKDCKVYFISDGIKSLYVVRCPNSQVTTQNTDKAHTNVSVIDNIK